MPSNVVYASNIFSGTSDVYLGPPRTLFPMSRENQPSRNSATSTPLRGTHSTRQTPNRTRHNHDSTFSSPEWEGSKISGNSVYGYHQSTSNPRNQHKSNNTGSNSNSSNNNNHSKNSHDSDNQELLDKFEALGRERRGDTASSYRVVDDFNEPEWLDPTENDTELPVPSGHSIQEFEEWKAKMKADERRRAGLSDESVSTNPPVLSREVKPSETSVFDSPDNRPGLKSVDRLFGMWDSPQKNDPNLAAMGRASRFSRFFKGDSAPSSPAGQAPPGLSMQPLEAVDHGSPVNSIFASVSTPHLAQPAPSVPTSDNDADRKGFMRIMAMLGDNPGEPQVSPSPAPVTPVPAEKAPEPPAGDDAFFMSLLNKSSDSGPSPIAHVSPDISTSSPTVASMSPMVSRGVTPATQNSQLSLSDANFIQKEQQQFRVDPYFSGPPPEWIQQQVGNGQYPNNGPPPGFIPPPFMGMPMPPPGMLHQFPPNQNGMPPLPPHMMPPPGSYYNGPPPPMNFPMQQQQGHLDGMNGHLPPGLAGMPPLPHFGMPPKGPHRRFEGHKVN